MSSISADPLRVDRSKISVATLSDISDEKAYWLSRPPQDRMHHIEILRRMNYGHSATLRLQRVLEITQR
jgi:hypothetical protein